MDIRWVKIESWHAARPRDYTETAYCGRSLEGQTEFSDELPAGKSCESCLRITARLIDDVSKAAA
jgi:hypothetical protein